MLVWLVVYVVTSVHEDSSSIDLCRVIVATQVPEILRTKMRLLSTPTTRMELDHWPSPVIADSTFCPTEVSVNNAPTISESKYALEAVRVVSPVNAPDVMVKEEVFTVRNGPSSGSYFTIDHDSVPRLSIFLCWYPSQATKITSAD